MIISLIIAGVTAGASLVRASQLRSVTTDMQSFQASINAFKLQYNALPGDLTNASSYWTCPNNGGNNLNCNGNGDRQVVWVTGGNGGGNNNNESTRFFQHLQLAGLLPSYSQMSGTSPTNYYTTSNSPASRIKNTLYMVGYGNMFLLQSNNAINLGCGDGSLQWHACFTLTPVEAQSIDAKMDDGVANTGHVYGASGTAGAATCSAMYNSAGGADYNLAGSGPCILSFRGF